ncbi:SAM-dependent methyltransferase [Chryseobacterium sp. T16E-39]|uniref:class I SAM-dependent methyltransferase n=1 Tax=Chryseobacterium sp. T16E-39 TaxID=2015076 RepID=UPI000B5B2BA5|nr:class I SAM-dependent methyltransferase [Chryseobacterium sp. T16E-39]ASK28617.1 SAM-dependent methyltransferase [Chryseobacterium sp. T16E-39]
MKKEIYGTRGYVEALEKFTKATLSIDFFELHQDFIQFIPKKPGSILDIGAGIGRDAAVFSEMGHSVTAVEPLQEFRTLGKELFPDSTIEWLDDSLPELTTLKNSDILFDFVLASGIWHHLAPEEQYLSISKIASLTAPNGIFALTLRNGPAGVGSHIYDTNGEKTIRHAEQLGFKTLMFLENQPSLIKGKENVMWSKLVFQKQPS